MKKLPIHPILLAAYAVLALFAHNIEEIPFTVTIRTLLFSLVATLALFGILRLTLKDWRRAGLVASLLLALFFSYGHLYAYLENVQMLGVTLGRHRILALVWLALGVLGSGWLFNRKRDLAALTQGANAIALLLLAFPVIQIIQFGLRPLAAPPAQGKAAAPQAALHLPQGKPAPDIYYIILDAYSRDDTLLDYYGIDNRPFLDQLQGLGFYIGRCSRSNYAQTQLSLASSLNMEYLSELSPDYRPPNRKKVGIEEFIRHSAVRQALEDLGYTTVAFETGFKGTQWEDADRYLSPRPGGLERMEILGGLNGFEALFLRTTAGLILADGAAKLPAFLRADFDNPQRIHYERVLYVLEQLEAMPALPGPKLVFAHIVMPHPPFVFGKDGEFIPEDREDFQGYSDQVAYIDRRMVPLLENLISESPVPPIIILQGDHGGVNTSPGKRPDILNAYYLPDGGAENLYESISPVNTFRVIFDTYYGGRYELLPEKAYFSVYDHPFDLMPIPEARAGCPTEAR